MILAQNWTKKPNARDTAPLTSIHYVKSRTGTGQRHDRVSGQIFYRSYEYQQHFLLRSHAVHLKKRRLV